MAERLSRGLTAVATGAALLALPPAAVTARGSGPTPPAAVAPAAAARTPTPVPRGALRIGVVLRRGSERLPGADSVAWLPEFPAAGLTTPELAIAQRGKQFQPRVAVAAVGSTVGFPNFDRVFHNVFSLSRPKAFDLGLYRGGRSKTVRFDQPGLVQVYCNIHPQMSAYLMVVDSRHHGVGDGGGTIRLDGIPTGARRVEGWNVRGGLWSRDAVVSAGRTTELEVELDISSWREAPHLNKHGKEYPPPDDDEFRY
ncbi:MAG: hypothetical protein MUE90_01555 [Thermoanaerobaculales bacterium]|jgi:plastocyanin|nr:hypothetical protein [Thermoanaerobaculales bacterium]